MTDHPKNRSTPVAASLDAGLRKWLDADKREQRRALEDRIRRLRQPPAPNRMHELLRIIAGKDQ